MATCKDCIHSGICKMERQPAPLSDTFTYECECIEKYCIDFKSCSRFVELPCKVGERLYVPIPKSKYIAEYVVIAFWVEESGTIIRIVDTRFFTVSVLFVQDIGTKAFLTKEQAEQALKLKEREENE